MKMDDLPILELDQIFMTSSAYLATGFKDVWATFDLLVRDMPDKNQSRFAKLGRKSSRASFEAVRVLTKPLVRL